MLLAFFVTWAASTCAELDHYTLFTCHIAVPGLHADRIDTIQPTETSWWIEEPEDGAAMCWQEIIAKDVNETILPPECQPGLPVLVD